MKELVMYILVMHSVLVVLDKYSFESNLKNWLMNRPNKVTKFLFEVVECRFCWVHHLAMVVTLMSLPLVEFRIELLFYPLCFASFENVVAQQ